MSDLVKRLRETAEFQTTLACRARIAQKRNWAFKTMRLNNLAQVTSEAADRIERLEAFVGKVRAHLPEESPDSRAYLRKALRELEAK